VLPGVLVGVLVGVCVLVGVLVAVGRDVGVYVNVGVEVGVAVPDVKFIRNTGLSTYSPDWSNVVVFSPDANLARNPQALVPAIPV
jgi:hypothetical protein